MPVILSILSVLLWVKGLGGTFYQLFEDLGVIQYHGPIVGFLISAFMFSTFYLYATAPQIWDKTVKPISQKQFRFLMTAVIGLVGIGTFLMINHLQKMPIDVARADMLPVILSGLQDVVQGMNPYHPHMLSNGAVIHHYYGPTLWLGYLPFYGAGVDIRYLNIGFYLFLCFCLLTLFLEKKQLSTWSFPISAGVFLLLIGLVLISKQTLRHIADLHLAPLWISYVIFLLSIFKRWTKLTLLTVPFLLLARETALLLIAPYAIYLYRTHKKVFWKISVFTTAVLVIVISLSLIHSPMGGILSGIIHYMDHFSGATTHHMLAHYGLSGLLRLWGLYDWHWPIKIAGMLVGLGISMKLPCDHPVRFLAVGGMMYLWFILFVSITWGYTLMEPLILTLFLITSPVLALKKPFHTPSPQS